MKRIIYLEGQTVGEKRVLSGGFCPYPKKTHSRNYYLVAYPCGHELAVATTRVAENTVCGTCRNEMHGKSKHPMYQAWALMLSRCKPGGNKNYGGRGIKVCERWKSSFATFLSDMGERPSPRHSIDRIDVNGDYEPGNCRWATPRLQSRNLRNNHLIFYLGRGWNLDELASHAGLKRYTLRTRLKNLKWPVEVAVETPLRTN